MAKRRTFKQSKVHYCLNKGKVVNTQSRDYRSYSNRKRKLHGTEIVKKRTNRKNGPPAQGCKHNTYVHLKPVVNMRHMMMTLGIK